MHLLDITAKAVADICNANDKIELKSVIHSAVQSLGFDSFNLGSEKTAKGQFMTDPTLTNWSYDDLVAYERNGWSERDPLLDYAASSGAPLHWTHATWQAQNRFDYLEYVQSSGLVSGVTVPLLSKPDQISALTLLSWSAREHHKDVTQAAAILGMVATQRAAAIGLISGQTSVGSAKYRSLSPLQREILKWMAGGKTNTEIAVILGQTKRSIDYHVIEILKKLEVSTRTQAAAIFASL